MQAPGQDHCLKGEANEYIVLGLLQQDAHLVYSCTLVFGQEFRPTLPLKKFIRQLDRWVDPGVSWG
jgi:hypothetical protein